MEWKATVCLCVHIWTGNKTIDCAKLSTSQEFFGIELSTNLLRNFSFHSLAYALHAFFTFINLYIFTNFTPEKSANLNFVKNLTFPLESVRSLPGSARIHFSQRRTVYNIHGSSPARPPAPTLSFHPPP